MKLLLDTFFAWLKDYGIVSFLLINFTWVYFTAVMRLRELRDAGKLEFKTNPTLFCFAYPNLAIGLILDALVNFIVATVVMWEIPQEILTTTRLCRWYNSTDTSWYTRNVRMRFVRFGQNMLDVVDTDGKHIK